MTADEQRQAVIDEALSWQRTPHHNGARIKGQGVDCGQFPIAVYHAVGLMPAIPDLRYKHDFHLHRDREWYKEIADAHGKQLPADQLPGPADFCLYKIGRVFSHGAIVIKWPRIIHAAVNIGVVLDEGDQGRLAKKEVIFYTLWDS